MPRVPHFVPLTLPVMLGLAVAVSAGQGVERHPLPDRTSATRGPLFTTFAPEVTGVTVVNRFDDPRIWAERYETFAFGSIGTGVAIGDYDGDGRPDIYLAGKAARGRLYRNLGDWRFEDVTDAAGLGAVDPEWETGTAFVDIDNDGDLDLFVCRTAAANLLWVNQGDGTFIEEAGRAGLALVDASVMGAFADYDRDGWLDVFVQTNLLDIAQSPHGQRDRLYRNRGDGTFHDVTDTARLFGRTQGHAAVWWDPDEDGWPDLYVGNDFAAPDQLYLNRRDGVFVNVIDAVAPAFPYFAMGMDFGDVNNDGRFDLLVTDMLPTRREQYVSGMLNMQAKTAADAPPNLAAQHMRNVLLLGTGTARFQEAAILAGVAASGWTWSARFEDLDEDGRVDLHLTNGMFRDFLDADFLERVNQVDLPTRRRLVHAAPELRENNLTFRNRGDLEFKDVGAEWGLDHHGISFGTAFGDLDGDGDLDLVIANYNGTPSLCRNESAGTHRVLIALRGTASNRFGIGARLRIEAAKGEQVRTIMSARGYLSTSEPVAHFGLGAATVIDRLTIEWPSGAVQVVEDLPADHRFVITEPAENAAASPRPRRPRFQDISEQAGLNLVVTEKPVDEFTRQPLLPSRQHSLGPGVAVGDLNGDGLDDVIVGGVVGFPRQVLLQDGPRHRASGKPVFANDAQVSDASILIFEANGDGIPDVLVTRGGMNASASDPAFRPRLFFGRGNAVLEEAPRDALPEVNVSAGPAVVADFDRDGWLDVFVGGRVVPGSYASTPRSGLWRNVGGRFVDVTNDVVEDLAEAGRVQAALWSDVDKDGWVDLLVAPHWGPVRCWRNQEGRRFVEVTDAFGFGSGGKGWWNSIAAADFNGDGIIDYAVGNTGVNTRYRATPDEPHVLLAGEFDSSGRTQLIESETVGGRLMPIRARESLLSVMPALRRRVPTYHRYAQMTVEDLVGSDRFEAARRLEVTELRSGVFLSTTSADGHRFRFVPFPRIAQIAPVYGLVAGDFDGDGRADLYAVQNTHAPHPEIGHFSGGVSQLLLGDGRGGFIDVHPSESGLVVNGEARGLVVKDFNLDGWPDFVVTRRDMPMLAYLNRPIEGRASVSIRLKGAERNPNALGARVTLVHRSGAVQAGEVYAGGGYLSQSAAAVFFGFEEADPPREIRVAWPDGASSSHRFPVGVSTIELASPERKGL